MLRCLLSNELVLQASDRRGDIVGEVGDKLLGLAHQQLERIKVLCDQSGLKYVELSPALVGVGIAISFGQTDYVVLSIMGGGCENQLMVTSGVLADLKRDRLAALEAANNLTRSNTAFPIYLHDAEIGWALVLQQTHPIELLLDVPQFFTGNIRAVPQNVIECRRTIPEKWDLGGRPWEWTPEDIYSLLTRSML
jgi:hypothetical protein